MNLQEICKKYRISDNYLNSKDDALLVTAASLDDIIFRTESNYRNNYND